jgi:hypothetical protein
MGRPRNQAEIIRDRYEIARLYLKGELQADIASRLGINQSTVSRDLTFLHKQWIKAAEVNFSEAVAVELQKINNLEIEYWQAWERSMQIKESSTAKVISDSSGERNEAGTKQEQMIGDEKFLAGVRWCIDRRLKLFGLDAPIKIDWRQTLPADMDANEVEQEFLNILRQAAEVDATASD